MRETVQFQPNSDELLGRLGAQTMRLITSATSTTFTVGTNGSFTVTVNGYPAASISESGTLPLGVAFDDATSVLGCAKLAAAMDRVNGLARRPFFATPIYSARGLAGRRR